MTQKSLRMSVSSLESFSTDTPCLAGQYSWKHLSNSWLNNLLTQLILLTRSSGAPFLHFNRSCESCVFVLHSFFCLRCVYFRIAFSRFLWRTLNCDARLFSFLSLFASLHPQQLLRVKWTNQEFSHIYPSLFVSCLSVGGPRWQIQVSLAGRLPSNITFVTTVDERSMWVEWQVSDRPVSNNYFDCYRYSAVSLWLYKTVISIDFVKFQNTIKEITFYLV